METVIVRGLEIGKGRPKIILPLTGVTREELLEQTKQIKALPCHMVEWRLDWYEEVFDQPELLEMARVLREALGELPILATFRTAKEGGEKAITDEEYRKLIYTLAESGLIDLVDIEAFSGDGLVKELIAICRANGVKTVLSNHDFHKTPEKEEIVRRLKKMEALGADIPKIALMPQSPDDVLTLLAATLEASRSISRPIITMSMGSMGVVSRLVGETFGSAMTFGSPGRASAPGQVTAKELDLILNVMGK